jgi:squalene-hopene/tetraprenyl-beta-curcumene cyclase
MKILRDWSLVTVAFIITAVGSLFASEPLTLENVVPPKGNRPDEPFRDEFSLPAAVQFLDSVALSWQKEQTCFACHSNYAFLLARPAISHKVPAHREIRSALERLAENPRQTGFPVTEAVMVASVLSQNDAATTGTLHPSTRKALDRIWTAQREDGGWTWLKIGQPPSEIDDHYGVTMAAIGVGVAPDAYGSAGPR